MKLSEKLSAAAELKREIDAEKNRKEREAAAHQLQTWTKESLAGFFQEFEVFIEEASKELSTGGTPPQSDLFQIELKGEGRTTVKVSFTTEFTEELLKKIEKPLSGDETQEEVLRSIAAKFREFGFRMDTFDLYELMHFNKGFNIEFNLQGKRKTSTLNDYVKKTMASR